VKFEVAHRDGPARSGTLTLAHGAVETPAFMPVGTYGTVKAMSPAELEENGAQIVLGNTFHLWLRPGLDVIEKHGGLHGFMGWKRPLLTDSGGFQVFSLATMRKLSEEGVRFASPINGDRLMLTPEESIRIQRVLGSDIAMVFDECPPHDAPAKEQRLAVERTIRWARECREQPRADGQKVFGIVQGGSDAALREQCAKALVAMEFDGYAIGGVSVGEPEPEMMRAIELAEPHLPAHKARYAMGLGTPAQMIELIARGVDMFDCVLPTRIARTGTAVTHTGAFGLKGASYKTDFGPIEEGCECYACRTFTRAYLRHLLRANEILGLRMVSVHNSHLYLKVMTEVRAAIAEGTFADYHRNFIANYKPSQKILAARKAASDER
jgi:queuine tRNA-ribosyltransferase